MELNESLLSECEEFFELIPTEKHDSDLDRAIDSLRTFIEHDLDGRSHDPEDVFARAVQCRLMEIWGLISKADKAADPNLSDYYENVMSQLEDVSGYETDDCTEE